MFRNQQVLNVSFQWLILQHNSAGPGDRRWHSEGASTLAAPEAIERQARMPPPPLPSGGHDPVALMSTFTVTQRGVGSPFLTAQLQRDPGSALLLQCRSVVLTTKLSGEQGPFNRVTYLGAVQTMS